MRLYNNAMLILTVIMCACILAMQFARAETTVVQKGYYEVWCDEAKVSQHTSYHKALEVAVNRPGVCILKSPEISVTPGATVQPQCQEPNMEGYRVTATWEAPSQRENGTPLPITEISHFNLYGTRDDGLVMDKIQVVRESGVTVYRKEYLLAPGNWSFAASAVDIRGLESALSVSVSIALPKQIEVVQ